MSVVVQVLIQILLVIALSRLVGSAFRLIKQPLVIGEIVAGIMLGPSLLGLVAPELASTLFPAATIPYLGVLSQIGLIFFMFLIGLELDPKYLRGQLQRAVLVSHTSILLPFILGSALALLLYPQLSSQGVSFTAFALFLGSAMSITAFPVLGRILTENNLQKTRLGTLALTCAAVDDVTAWCLLAVAIAVTRTNSFVSALPTIGLALLYIGFMFTGGRWLLDRLADRYRLSGRLNQATLALTYMGVVVSALVTEQIGIHLIFGAFLMGAVMPRESGLIRDLAQKTEDFVLTFLLPIFFAYSGLRTQIGLIDRPYLWFLCGLVLLVAIAGKFIGTFVAARYSGLPNRDAAALGWLMNTRGLTELIVLNIGLSLGVISPLLFTMLVIMALVTTFMTSPLLEATYAKRQMRQDIAESEPDLAEAEGEPYRLLVPIANPETQTGLLSLALALAGTGRSAYVQPLHLLQLEEDYTVESTPLEATQQLRDFQRQLRQQIQQLPGRQQIHPIVRLATDVGREAVRIAEFSQANLILMGWHRSGFHDNRLGGRVGQILSQARTDVAIFIDRPPERLQRLLVPYATSRHDDLALELALRLLLHGGDRQLTVLRVGRPDGASVELSNEMQALLESLPPSLLERVRTPVVFSDDPLGTILAATADADLTIAGASRHWGIERQTLGYYTDALSTDCRSSLLITRRYTRTAQHLPLFSSRAEVHV